MLLLCLGGQGGKGERGKLGNDQVLDSSSEQWRGSQSQVSVGSHALGNKETNPGFHQEPEIFRNVSSM